MNITSARKIKTLQSTSDEEVSPFSKCSRAMNE